MPATVIAIADAVTAVINDGSFAQTFTAERAYVPVHELTELVDLKVTVVPASLSAALLTRGSAHLFDYVIDVGIQQKKEPTVANLDPLMLLVERIVDLFRGKPLAVGSATAHCTLAENRLIFAPDHLDEKRVFTSVVSLTFRMGRAAT